MKQSNSNEIWKDTIDFKGQDKKYKKYIFISAAIFVINMTLAFLFRSYLESHKGIEFLFVLILAISTSVFMIATLTRYGIFFEKYLFFKVGKQKIIVLKDNYLKFIYFYAKDDDFLYNIVNNYKADSYGEKYFFKGRKQIYLGDEILKASPNNNHKEDILRYCSQDFKYRVEITPIFERIKKSRFEKSIVDSELKDISCDWKRGLLGLRIMFAPYFDPDDAQFVNKDVYSVIYKNCPGLLQDTLKMQKDWEKVRNLLL